MWLHTFLYASTYVCIYVCVGLLHGSDLNQPVSFTLCHQQTGPVRLFVPYKRRKKDSESDNALPSPKKLRTAAKSPTITASPMAKEGTCIIKVILFTF